MNKPKISVILTLYNRPQFMAEAIDSVLSQTLIDFELLLIDDGSTNEKVAEIAREYESKDARVRYFYKQNGGVVSARNFAVEHSATEIIAFCEDDDIQEPRRLQTQFDYLQNHADIAGVTCERINIDTTGKIIDRQPKPKTEAVVEYCSGPTIMIRRNEFLAVGRSYSFFRAADDIDFALRFIEADYISMRLPQRLLRFRHHDDGNLSNGITAWRFVCAAYYSASCRRQGQPDPITNDATLENVLEQAATSDFSLRIQFFINARNLAKEWLRKGGYAEAREIIREATDYFGGDAGGARYAKKMRRDMTIWAVQYGKFGYFRKTKTNLLN